MHPWLLKIFNDNTKWIAGIIIGCIFSAIVGLFVRLEQYNFVILTLGCVLIFAIFALICCFIISQINGLDVHCGNITTSIGQLNETKDYIRQLTSDGNCVAQEITLKDMKKKVIFNDQSLQDSKTCFVECYWEIQNNMETNYNKYFFRLQSTRWVPQFEDFHFFKEDREVTLGKKISGWEHAEHYGENPSILEKNTRLVADILYLPVQISSKESNKIQLNYHTEAYSEEALKGKIDSIGLQVNKITEKFTICVSLEGEFGKHYTLSEIEEPRPDSFEKYDIQVLDHSNVRMDITEKELKKNDHMPIFSDSNLSWVVPNPKIGYMYTVFFTLKKNDSVMGKILESTPTI